MGAIIFKLSQQRTALLCGEENVKIYNCIALKKFFLYKKGKDEYKRQNFHI